MTQEFTPYAICIMHDINKIDTVNLIFDAEQIKSTLMITSFVLFIFKVKRCI